MNDQNAKNVSIITHGIEARFLMTLLRRASRTVSVIGFAAANFLSLVILY